MLKLAGGLRKQITPAEKILWEHLRNKQLLGFRFRRQHPIAEFVVDFFCYEMMLVIEINGAIHDTPYQKERDSERSTILRDFGINEIRFRNEDVMQNIENVLTRIKAELMKKYSLTPLPPSGGRDRGIGLKSAFCAPP